MIFLSPLSCFVFIQDFQCVLQILGWGYFFAHIIHDAFSDISTFSRLQSLDKPIARKVTYEPRGCKAHLVKHFFRIFLKVEIVHLEYVAPQLIPSLVIAMKAGLLDLLVHHSSRA